MYYLDLTEERFFDLEDLPGEVWADVKDFCIYQISNWGRLKTKERWRKGRYFETTGKYASVYIPAKIRRIKYDKDGYVEYALSTGEHKKMVFKRGHLLVAEAFIPNPNSLPIINHKNQNTSDCRASNLEWCDYSYNRNYSFDSVPCKKIEYKGFVYNSIRECSRALKTCPKNIRYHIKNNTPYNGFYFKEVYNNWATA